MVFSCVTTNLFSILPLFVVLLITPLSSSLSPTDKVTKEILYNLCSKPTIFNHFCTAWLESDPTTFTVDVNGLLGLVIEKTYLLGLKNIAMMKGLARTATDPILKYEYGYCVIDYELAIKTIEVAKGLASSKEYKLAAIASYKALDSITSCEAELKGKANVPAYLVRTNLMFERMCNIGQVFSYALLAS